MSFEGQYLTYTEYQSLGGTLDETPFNLLEYEVRKKIDVRTLGRLKDLDEIPQEVKLCEYNLIDSIESYYKTKTEMSNVKNLKSESIDGYSVSYITGAEIADIIKSKATEIDDIIFTYLAYLIVNNEHAIYCGVN